MTLLSGGVRPDCRRVPTAATSAVSAFAHGFADVVGGGVVVVLPPEVLLLPPQAAMIRDTNTAATAALTRDMEHRR
jgi:hypothetical protein